MNSKRTVGIAACIFGIILLLAAMYVQNEVNKGRGQIARAERATSTTKGFLSSQNSQVQKYGGKAVGYVEGRVGEGKEQADFYQKVCYVLIIAGTILFLIGVYLIFKRRT